MNLAIMQPYLLPYLGYLQLLRACDLFVAFDDVQYKKGSWINRNRIEVDGRIKWLTLPVVRAPFDRTIDQRIYLTNGSTVARIRRQVHAAYRGAPYFRETLPLLERILTCPDPNVASFNVAAIRALAGWLELDCKVVRSSTLQKQGHLRGEARILDICQRLGATRYVNPIGGVSLYDGGRFAAQGVELRFLRPRPPADARGHLSILDTLMTYGREGTRALLDDFALLTSKADLALARDGE
jgi:hypothetical protein